VIVRGSNPAFAGCWSTLLRRLVSLWMISIGGDCRGSIDSAGSPRVVACRLDRLEAAEESGGSAPVLIAPNPPEEERTGAHRRQAARRRRVAALPPLGVVQRGQDGDGRDRPTTGTQAELGQGGGRGFGQRGASPRLTKAPARPRSSLIVDCYFASEYILLSCFGGHGWTL